MRLELSEVWVILTAIYALTALVALAVIIVGGVFLGLKVKRLVKAMKATPKRVKGQVMGTWGRVRERGEGLGKRGRRAYEASAESAKKVGESVRRVGLMGGE